ncbi:glycoside hydrolase family 75 protein [Streptomyces fructofermentans]|uniref:glycoside hydrolase family 75 protein n=1 Tax=Streptomyces fructofermentans TaxID=152141 RepID=UPI00379E0B91
MRMSTLTLAVTAGAALLGAASIPAGAAPGRDRTREGAVTASELLAEVTSCSRVSRGKYRTDHGSPATVPVCGLKGAVFWKADMDIDCDGQVTAHCNRTADPWFQSQTAFTQSDGRPLVSEKLPYVVVPGPSALWDYRAAGLKGGSVVAVVHGDRVGYAVVGDTGPREIIGEASYAAARSLGVDPDPATGGTAAEVTYILFTGSRVRPIEDHGAAVALGQRLAEQFLRDN